MPESQAPEPGTPRWERAAELLFSGTYDDWPAWKLRELIEADDAALSDPADSERRD